MTLGGLDAARPLLLALLPLALLPWLPRAQAAARHPCLALVPRDALGMALELGARLAACVAIAFTVLGMAGIARGGGEVERLGRGAEVMLLLDRSRSMDQAFVRRVSLDPAFAGRSESKGQAARRFLARFCAERSNDLFAMIEFSTGPIPVLEFTPRQDMIQAAISAAGIGRGLAETDIARALLAAAARFDDRPYAGSRVILLVSDGGAQIDEAMQRRITRALRRNRIALYWIYLRSYGSGGIRGAGEDDATTPERALHRFFGGMGMPYKAYEAEDPEALGRAIADVSALQNLPIHYTERLPALDRSRACYLVAAVATLLLLGVQLLRRPAP